MPQHGSTVTRASVTRTPPSSPRNPPVVQQTTDDHNILIVPLPSVSSDLATRRNVRNRHRTFSVRFIEAPCSRSFEQLEDIVSLQRPYSIVVSSSCSWTASDVQRAFDIVSRYVEHVTVFGIMTTVGSGEIIALNVPASLRTVGLVDSASSTHGSNIVIFGDLRNLDTLHVEADSHVFVTGQTAMHTRLKVRSRSLMINGMTLQSYQ